MTDLAKQMWEAYAKQAGNVTFDGKPLSDWDGLGADRQLCWVASANVAAIAAATVVADRIESLEKALRAAEVCATIWREKHPQCTCWGSGHEELLDALGEKKDG